jgi:pSer/pThr/pTyr-binding forkhead associated (FHA) protein
MAVIVQLHEGVAINKFELDKPLIRIGRDPDSEIFIDDKVVSLDHAVVEIDTDPSGSKKPTYIIRDLGSTNQTFVNDRPITRQELQNNDQIRVGWNTFKFIEDTERKRERTLKIHKSWIPRVYYTKE